MCPGHQRRRRRALAALLPPTDPGTLLEAEDAAVAACGLVQPLHITLRVSARLKPAAASVPLLEALQART